MSDELRPSRKLWILAAVAALVLHLGGAALALAHLRADRMVSYESLMDALNLLRDAGYHKVALVGLEKPQ